MLQFLAKGLGFQDNMAFVECRAELGNYNEIYGIYITMKKAFAMFFKFFLFFTFVTIAALG